MTFPTVNILAIIVAAIINVVIAALWFNAPFLFRDTWLAGIDKSAEQVAAGFSPLKPLLSLIGNLIAGLVLAWIIAWSGANGPLEGLLIGLLVGIAFAAMTSAIKDSFEGRPLKLWLINAGHDVLTLALMGLIIGLWRA